MQKKNEEQTKEKKQENCLFYLHKTLKAIYKQQSNTLETSEELEKLKGDINEILKNNELFQGIKIPAVELKEVEFFLNNHELIDIEKILEFSMVLK